MTDPGPRREAVGLPPRTFLYTLDQVGEMLSLSLPVMRQRYVYFEGHSFGHAKRTLLFARNISPDSEADWRIAESELIRWMRFKKFRFHTRGWIEV